METVSIITGDIINSKSVNSELWLPLLKQSLNKYAQETIFWEVYRGDSFQIEVNPNQSLEAALFIKASIKQFETLDVRIAIGIGGKSYAAKNITESNGTAFINSGECFDSLKKRTLAVKTDNTDFDYTINTMFQLALISIDHWTVNSAKLFRVALEHPNYNQKEIASLLGKSQSTISEGLKRSGFTEIKKLLDFYTYKLQQTAWEYLQ